MTQVIALQMLPDPATDAHDVGELEKVSEFSIALCGPFPSELSSWGCI